MAQALLPLMFLQAVQITVLVLHKALGVTDRLPEFPLRVGDHVHWFHL